MGRVSLSFEEEPSHYKEKKACRVCDDFRSWRKKKTMQDQSKLESSGSDLQAPNDCPLDTEQLGRSTWSFLHTMAAYYPEKPTETQKQDMRNFIDLFAKFYPCYHCAADLQENVKAVKPDVRSCYTLSNWFCVQHNIVNRKLSKPEFDCSKVMERWRDGWKDGSCD